MATIELSVRDDVISELLDFFDEKYPGRTSQTKIQWAKARVADKLRVEFLEWKRQKAASEARALVFADLDIIG